MRVDYCAGMAFKKYGEVFLPLQAQDLPEYHWRGVMLFHHARKVASTIERIHEHLASYGEQ